MVICNKRVAPVWSCPFYFPSFSTQFDGGGWLGPLAIECRSAVVCQFCRVNTQLTHTHTHWPTKQADKQTRVSIPSVDSSLIPIESVVIYSAIHHVYSEPHFNCIEIHSNHLSFHDEDFGKINLNV